MLQKELNRILENPQFISSLESALAVLEDHRIIHFLRAHGRCNRNEKSNHEQLAIDGAYNAGWQDAIDTLVNFKELFLMKRTPPQALTPDYGGRRKLFNDGTITEEEFKNGYTNSPSNAKRRTAGNPQSSSPAGNPSSTKS